MNQKEVFISVDVETAGPIPGDYSLLTIGACLTNDLDRKFTCRLKPVTFKAEPKALEVTGLSLEQLTKDGEQPKEAMARFKSWIEEVSGSATPVFVGLNAPFDWGFINYYFHHFLDENPFGFAALDIKSMFFGHSACSWRDTRSSEMKKILEPTRQTSHDALEDAQAQGEMFSLLYARVLEK